jgi:3-carboxy-cis,cis-muconate cycloisomerase
MALLDALFGWPELDAIFSDAARLQAMLDFEAALARAEAACGVIPAAAATAIAGACQVQFFDLARLRADAAQAGNLAIPMLRQLTARLGEKDAPGAAADLVHWGATSQDAIDTGAALQLRAALDAVLGELNALCANLTTLVDAHRATVIAGRTWMQHAAPTTFGVKVAGWLDALLRHRVRLAGLHEHALVLQFGGAVGTLSALDGHAENVALALAKELSLTLPAVSWHSHRDRVAEVATTFGLLTGTLGKIARDISLHAQTEIGELREPAGEGRGASSSMPQKRNPVGCALVLSAALRVPGLVSTVLAAMVQEDERGLGGWHAEWETIPQIVCLSGGALRQLSRVVAGLEVDTGRMRENMDLEHGLLFAEAVTTHLAPHLGKRQARRIVEEACGQAGRRKMHLRDVLLESPEILKHASREEIAELFDPQKHVGASEAMIDAVLRNAKGTKFSLKEESA